jgi:hypothetical protein
MAEENAQGSKQAVSRKSLFRQISKGDLVTIHDEAGERKGRATSREYGNWVLVLLFGTGTALATPQNVRAVNKPKAMEEIPEAGQHFVYDDGRPGHINSRAEILEVTSRSRLVQFENYASPTLIYFDDPEWMDYITFEAKGGQPRSAADVEAEGKRRE